MGILMTKEFNYRENMGAQMYPLIPYLVSLVCFFVSLIYKSQVVERKFGECSWSLFERGSYKSG